MHHDKCNYRFLVASKALISLILFTALWIDAFSQEEFGLNPPGMKWRQIHTPAGRIIFPRGLDSLAFRTAALVNYQSANDASIAGERSTKMVPQIIQNQSTLPAGFSTPAPWRNEYYNTPPANMFLGPLSWNDAMVIHEYRHAQQFSMANQGLTWPYKVLFGQTGWLLNSLVTQPLWFREGDAVLAETMFTNGGRGRLPSFHMEYRALRLAGYRYNYEKAHYTSLRNFVPNPYRIGYYMVSKARRTYGNDIWNKVLNDTYRKKGIVYPFSRSLKKFTGSTTREFYNKTVAELDSVFEIEDKALTLTESKVISDPETKKYTNYRFPQYVIGDSIVVLKSSFEMIPTFYLITPDGKERKLFSPGRYSDDHVTLVAHNGKMVWAESAFHERYVNKDYSIIKIHDLRSGDTRKLTSRTRYFSPSLSNDTRKIFVTETDLQNRYFHLVLNADDGSIVLRRPNPDGVFLSHPRWMKDDLHIVCVAVSQERGNALVRINSETGGMDVLVPYSHVPISRPFPAKDRIYWSAGRDGINNIYSFEISTGNISQVTSVRFGAFEPIVSADETKLVFSEYTADGYRVKEMAMKQQPTSRSGGTDTFLLQGILNTQEKDITDTLTIKTFEVKKFNALTSGLFNFYGWLVLPNIPEYGIEFYTQNLMSTLRGTVGALYNTNENRFHYYARATYAAWYPIIELEYNRGNRNSAMIASDDPEGDPFTQRWREDVLSAGVRLPFRLTQGTHNTRLTLEGRHEHLQIDFLDSADNGQVLSTNSFQALRSSLMFSRTKMQAIQHFNPRWGQVVNATFRQSYDGAARLFHVNALLYFPGLLATHSLNFRGAYKQEKVVNAYRFTDDFVMPRGYRPYPFENINLVSANYQLPIFYPDFSLGSVAFVQRLRWNVFYDHAVGAITGTEIEMQGPGTELFVDLRLFRLVQMTACLRYNFVPGTRNTALPEVLPALPEVLPFQFLVTRFELVN